MFLKISANGLSKAYNRREIFSNVNFQLKENDSLAITGRNGAGKSTLIKIIANIISQTKGEISISDKEKEIPKSKIFSIVGFVAPYLQLYDEFTALENMRIIKNIRNVLISEKNILELLNKVGLYKNRNDFVRTFSSGMKQRLKYACALLHDPPLLLLDEPNSNLDEEGVKMVWEIIEEQKAKGILVVATNEIEDSKLCTKIINLNKQEE